ncbi:hypothetical protein GGF46_003612 [Coemansia sp. RSA 552]|nr:hypothetical protein GGF46_003612 [Coemansia sp. RSA 552]
MREGGEVHGVLIDFDNAVPASKAQMDYRPICTGTLPFMSINNLEKSKEVPRTALDDIESFEYVLLWLGTWGGTREHRQAARQMDRAIANTKEIYTIEATRSTVSIYRGRLHTTFTCLVFPQNKRSEALSKRIKRVGDKETQRK